MSSKLVERSLVVILLVIAGGIVLHAPLTVWLGTVWPAYEQIIKAWKELLMGLAFVLLIVIAARQKMIGRFLSDRLIQLSLVYAGLHFIMISIFHPFADGGLQAAGAGLLIDLRFVLYFVLVYCTVTLLPQTRRAFIAVIAGGAMVVLGFALLQLFVLPRDILAHIGYSKQTIAPYLTVDQNPDYIRINSTLRGPNPLGAYVVIVLSAVLAVAIKYGRKLERRKVYALGGIATAAGIVLGASYSRSSLIGVLVAMVVTIGAVASVKARRRLAGIVFACVVVIAIILAIGRTNPVISNVIWHDNPTGGSQVDSNQGHAESLVDGTIRMLRQPLGGGVGSTGSASLDGKQPLIVENQYLFIAHEIGWLGLALFIWLFVEIMRRLWQRRHGSLALSVFASGCGLAVIGLLLPVWTDDTVSIIWWGLAAVAAGGAYTNARKNN
ncbi:MAG: O-antigen ligase family protein [Sulfuriferula sp.]